MSATDGSNAADVANGFLVLDHCDVYLGEESPVYSNENVMPIADPWFDIEVPSQKDISEDLPLCQASEGVPDESAIRHASFDVNADNNCCPYCYLMLLAKDPSCGEKHQRRFTNNDAPAIVERGNTPRFYSIVDCGGPEGSSNGLLRYDGTIKETKCHCCSGKQRSDAALMMGLALMSQDLGHIAIRSIKVGLYNTNFNAASRRPPATPTDLKPRNSSNNNGYRKEKACLLITFWCRDIVDIDLPNKQRRFFQHTTKQLLHPATQLIMSIMSSNWKEYDAKLVDLASLPSDTETIDEKASNSQRSVNVTSRIRRTRHRLPSLSFFPSKMNLEDVFQRISGVSNALLLSDPEFDPERKNTKKSSITTVESNKDINNNERIDYLERHQTNEITNCDKAATATTAIAIATKLTILPGDILCHNIGQYLRAKSLDSLRCTCKHLHWTLRVVVPGLKLRLYSHQIKSLMWMRGRESKQITENDLLVREQSLRHRSAHSASRNQSHSTRDWIKNIPDGDAHRAATGGGTVLFCPRRRQRRRGAADETRGDGEDGSVSHRNAAVPVRISQFDHSEVLERRRKYGNGAAVLDGHSSASIDPLARKVARGGLLCDDPGLGKTITVISLILQTLGLSTKKFDCENKAEKSYISKPTIGSSVEHEGARDGIGCGKTTDVLPGDNQPENALTANNQRIFDEYWKEQIIPEFRCKALTKLFSTFLRSSREINFFFDNYWMKEIQTETTIGTTSFKPPSLSLKDIRRRIDRSFYGDSLQDFILDVESCFWNAISNNSVSDLIRSAARRLVVVFRDHINIFKKSQIDIAIKSFSRASAKPDSTVAALIEKDNTEKILRALLPSSATLLVVPAVLVDHWMEQIKSNIDISYCTDKIPLVFEFTGSNKSNEAVQKSTLKCLVDQTHFPLVFVDRTATKKLPPPSFLAMFKMVLTTNNRFSCEWKNGSFEDEMRRNRKQSSRNEGKGRMTNFREDFAASEEACPLLKVNWLRMIVDEGHSMGRGRDNSSISFASWINAERRWAMTGTPTPQTSTQSGLMNVFNLMQYLKHDFFTRRYNGDIIWSKLIVKSWNIGHVSAFFRLRSLLSLLMIRHIKSNISELPLPIFNTNTLSMGYEEVSTYNTLVCAIQSNLIITSMKGKTSGAQDSLLHKSQTRHAREALSNLRLVCAGGTQVRPTLTTEYWIEFHQDFDDCNADPVQQKKIRGFITRATTGQQSKCDCCSVMLSTLLVFPCGHLVCTECVDSNTTFCVVCEKEFDVDAFQRLQPGFKYDWLHNVEEEMKQKSNSNTEKNQDANEPPLLPGGPGLLIPNNQRRRRARTRKYGDGHTCEYDPKSPKGQCILCFTEHEPCYLAGERRCSVCYRVAQDCPTSESKITHIIEILLKLYISHQETKKTAINEKKQGYKPAAFTFERRRTPKVIIFSQFRKVLNITGDRLLRRLGSGCIAEYWGKYRKKELNKFIKDEKCLCMLLGKDGSEGLDLSFVTHIIFLEQVWDKSLENQVVARAWRMGAKGSADVETLVAEHSIEETMLFLEKDLEQNQNDSDGSAPGIQNFRSTAKGKKRSEYQQAKVHYLLNNLKLIVNANTLDFSASNKRKASIDLETTLDTQQVGARSQAKKNGEKRHRVTFQDQLMKPEPSLILFG